MLARLPKIAQYFSSSSANLALKGLRDPAVRSQIDSTISANPEHQQKLDALANVILSLSNV